MQNSDHSSIVDVQGRRDTRALTINKVGIKGIRHPLAITGADGIQHTIATCNLYVNLTADQKGTHMSRFVEILNDCAEPLTADSLLQLLNRTVEHLQAENGYIEFSFPYFINKSAPVSGVKSLLDYDVHLIAEFVSGKPNLILQVHVPVTSLCPCSKEISQYGAHNQRSQVSITLYQAHDLWIDEIIQIVEQNASCDLFGILKRPDEKYVTEKAYENPKFVEDMVRDIAAVLNADPRVEHYQVTAENFESIHNHSAFAQIDG
ncbi:MAG: GTP cyclohydrolase FolE2 [Gammaproteobacteria bacterium]